MAPSLRLRVRYLQEVSDLEVDLEDGVEVLRIQLFSLTSVPPDEQKVLGIGTGPLRDDVDLASMGIVDGQEITLMSSQEMGLEDSLPAVNNCVSERDINTDADEEFARRLQAEEDAALAKAMAQAAMAEPAAGSYGHMEAQFRERLQSSVAAVAAYESEEKQRRAKALIPLQELEEMAAVALTKAGESAEDDAAMRDALLQQLLVWFKGWFSWVNSPACERCGGESQFAGAGTPTAEDLQWQGFRVENHRCSACGAFCRFVRYNDPAKLLVTRRGRCGEWANCFTLCCRALGYDARQVLDWTDHVWTECYSARRGRWLHLDPCEAAFDKPLLYESGWNKKLSYVIAFSANGVCDVTSRYTRKWNEVLYRRTQVPEAVIPRITAELTDRLRANMSAQRRLELEQRDAAEVRELEDESMGRTSDSQMQALPGRQTGSLEWRIARGELGKGSGKAVVLPADSLVSPEKLARDEHISRISLALGDICRTVVGSGEGDVERRQVLEILRNLKDVLRDLKALPYKSRSLELGDGASGRLKLLMSGKALPFFEAVGLGLFMGKGGELCGSDSLQVVPVREGQSLWLSPKTSSVEVALALPVANELLQDCTRAVEGGSASISKSHGPGAKLLWLVKGKRITGEAVYADGENASCEPAVAAFDGLLNTKWLHPDSIGQGAWLQYCLPAGKTAVLAGYIMTSANDCPERDPRDWAVEGSTDGGITWIRLDERRREVFEGRHMAKAYEISSTQRRPCSMYRLKVTAVGRADSCLQLACLDLYELRDAVVEKSRPNGAPGKTNFMEPKPRSELHVKPSSEEAWKAQFAAFVRAEFAVVRERQPELSVNEVAAEALRLAKVKMEELR